jgi:dipeptidyl aminopeptidase/acylaminoacyl peptidase
MPDGKEIVYSFGSTHGVNLWRISVLGSAKPKPLPFTGGNCPAISLESHRLVYGVISGSDINIWRCPIPKGAEKPGPLSILIASTQTKHYAQYSPDGKEIAYVSWDSGSPEIWICDSDGSNPLQLTHLGGLQPELPRWSPDGQQIVFWMTSGKQSDLYLIPTQGGQPKQLTNTPFNERNPSFSPDGKWIYLDSDRNGDSQVWKMPAGGGEQVQVTRKGGSNPQESMDGKSLFYLKGKTGYVSELWKVPVDGGEESRVLESVCAVNFDVKEHGIYYAESKYADHSRPDNEATFLFYDFTSGKTRPIATIRRPVVWGFSVSPDGHWILYSQWESGALDNLMLVENFR